MKCSKIGTLEQSPQNAGKHPRLHTHACKYGHRHTPKISLPQLLSPKPEWYLLFHLFLTQYWKTMLEKFLIKNKTVSMIKDPSGFCNCTYNVIINSRSIIVSLALHKHVCFQELHEYMSRVTAKRAKEKKNCICLFHPKQLIFISDKDISKLGVLNTVHLHNSASSYLLRLWLTVNFAAKSGLPKM